MIAVLSSPKTHVEHELEVVPIDGLDSPVDGAKRQ